MVFENRAYPNWLINREMYKTNHRPNDKSIRRMSKKFLFYYLFFVAERKHFYTEAAPRGFLIKGCFENMEQMHRRIPMRKCEV